MMYFELARYFLLSIVIVFVASRTGSMVYGYVAVIWLAFIVPNIGSSLLWSNCDRALVWKKFFSDSLSNLVTYLLIAWVVLLII